MTKRKTAASVNNNNRLIVFTKNPLIGRAKTRIAKTVGPIKAMDIFDRLIDLCQEVCRNSKFNVGVYYANFIDPLDAWNFGVDKNLQEQNPNLENRLVAAIENELLEHTTLIVIGSDCPALSVEHFVEAQHLLNDREAVIGPSEDGGFYLLGLKQFDRRLFNEVEWSSDTVCQQIKDNAAQINWSMAEMEVLNDIDDYSDWQKFVNG